MYMPHERRMFSTRPTSWNLISRAFSLWQQCARGCIYPVLFRSFPEECPKLIITSSGLVPGHQKNEIEGDLQMKPNENSLCLPSDRVFGSNVARVSASKRGQHEMNEAHSSPKQEESHITLYLLLALCLSKSASPLKHISTISSSAIETVWRLYKVRSVEHIERNTVLTCTWESNIVANDAAGKKCGNAALIAEIPILQNPVIHTTFDKENHCRQVSYMNHSMRCE
jgi:hypothetical protein